jgi:type II restriction/modification system DNA methylase subunit YeeA
LFGEADLFLKLIEQTRADGRDVGSTLDDFFEVLDTPQDLRKNIYPEFVPFPYVNGALFKGRIATHHFTSEARTALLECCKIDWSEISPAIFGTLFQAIMHFEDEKSTGKTKKRREFGAHYTSETNILKVISPLFLDALKEELEKARGKKAKLNAFHAKLFSLNFFDPAFGCGNFLVIAYREIRLLEAETLRELEQLTHQYQYPICDVDQFHGIEIDSTSAQIAVVALWIADHQMNFLVSNNGKPYLRLPLKHCANIVCANALRIDWNEVLPAEQCSFVMGNPPFVGYSYQSKDQKTDLANVFKGMNGAGVLDLVAAWHITAARYIQANSKISVAFVSTNSLTQGEQVAILWTELLKLNIKLHFAHRTFRWSNEGKGVAAVHCVIMGFHLSPVGANFFAQSSMERANKFAPTICRLFDYGDDIAGEPIEIQAKQINPYLVDAPTVLIEKRRKPLCAGAPEMTKGSQPTDGGHLLLSQEEADAIRKSDLIAAKYIRPFLGAEEFINNLPRFCLWLKDSTAQDRK